MLGQSLLLGISLMRQLILQLLQLGLGILAVCGMLGGIGVRPQEIRKA